MLKTLAALLILKTFIAEGFAQAIKQPPSKIASLSLASDEILLDMLPLCGGGLKRIVAVSTLADDRNSSSVTEKAKKIAARVHSEPESLFALKPDLVIAATFNRPELLNMTAARKIPLLTLSQFSSAEDIANNIEKIGDIVQCPNHARDMKKSFLEKIKYPTEIRNPLSLILYDSELVIMGAETLFDDLVKRAGATNAASKRGLKAWPKIDTEALVSMNPDAVVILEEDTRKLRQTISNHPAWRQLKAVQKNRFIFLNKRTAQSTSHYFADAVVELRQAISKNRF